MTISNQDAEALKSLPWPYPRLFAHRGGGALAPENTIAAMRMGAQCGYHAVEFDVKLSADNHTILLHDDTVDRTSNGTGLAQNMTLAQLQALDAGSWHSHLFTGERIPTLSTTAQFLQQHNLLANVEIKPCKGRDAETGEAVALECLKRWHGHAVAPLLSSFSVAALRAARKAAPSLAIGLLIDTEPDASVLPLLRELNCVSLHTNYKHINEDLLSQFKGEGYRVLCYTVNDPVRISALFALGVDGQFTDNLDLNAVN